MTVPTPGPTPVEQAIAAAWRVAGFVRDDEDPDVPTVHAWVHQAARVAAEAVAARVAAVHAGRELLIEQLSSALDAVDEAEAEIALLRAEVFEAGALAGWYRALAEREYARAEGRRRQIDAVKADRDRLSDQLTEVNIGCVHALAALAELVRLHDGPRDAAYERDKPKAWDAARRVLDPAPETPQEPPQPDPGAGGGAGMPIAAQNRAQGPAR